MGEHDVTGHNGDAIGLHWGIKPSLIMYAAGAPGGRLDVGPTVGGQGATFTFPYDAERTARLDDDGGGHAFEGSVVFHGHFGSFVGEIGDPEVRPGPGADWTLSILDRESGVRTDAFRLVGAPERSDDDTRLTWHTVEVSETGAQLWGGNYPVGTRFDPLAVHLP